MGDGGGDGSLRLGRNFIYLLAIAALAPSFLFLLHILPFEVAATF